MDSDYDENAQALERAFFVTLRQREYLERRGLSNHLRILNTVQFAVIWNWDLNALLRQLAGDPVVASGKVGWRKKLSARTLALSAYESLRKFDQLLDPNGSRRWSVAPGVRALDPSGESIEVLRRVHAKVCEVHATHAALLSGIRNNIIAHRDNDAAVQIEWIKRVSSEELHELGLELLRLTTDVIVALSAIVDSVQAAAPPKQKDAT